MLEQGGTVHDTTNTTENAIETILKLASTPNVTSITPIVPMIVERTSQYFSSPLCASRRNDRRLLMELALTLSVSQKDLCDAQVLRSMAESVCNELKSGIMLLSNQSLCASDTIRASLTDTLSLIVIVQKHLGKNEQWEAFARTVIEQLSSVSFTDQRLQAWVDDSLHLAWMCLTNSGSDQGNCRQVPESVSDASKEHTDQVLSASTGSVAWIRSHDCSHHQGLHRATPFRTPRHRQAQ